MIDYLDLALDQFYSLKEETLDEDRKCVGAENKKQYNIDSNIFSIKVEGFWHNGINFDYYVYNDNDVIIEKGKYEYYD